MKEKADALTEVPGKVMSKVPTTKPAKILAELRLETI